MVAAGTSCRCVVAIVRVVMAVGEIGSGCVCGALGGGEAVGESAMGGGGCFGGERWVSAVVVVTVVRCVVAMVVVVAAA